MNDLNHSKKLEIPQIINPTQITICNIGELGKGETVLPWEEHTN